jgi:hypothetical protein
MEQIVHCINTDGQVQTYWVAVSIQVTKRVGGSKEEALGSSLHQGTKSGVSRRTCCINTSERLAMTVGTGSLYQYK